MIDIKALRKNPNIVKEACQKKGFLVDIDRLLRVDQEKRELTKKIENIRHQKNKASKEIVKIKEKKEKEKIIFQMKELDKEEKKYQEKMKKLEEEFNSLFLQIPNIPFPEVPVGKDEGGNVVLREVGDKPSFNFLPKDHLELGESLDLIDVKRAGKIAGSRFGILKKEAVLIEFALVNFVLERLNQEGFIPVVPPVMLKETMARGTGYLEANDRQEAYYLPEDKFFLVGTSEQSIIAMHADEIFDEKDLPKRYIGFSTCFRREAGSYGKDTRGIFRVHQFDKLEMISFCLPENSRKEHLFFLELEEKLMQELKIPYRVVQICTGDLGRPAAEKYDIEAWIPSQNRYRETHSTSNCTDYQARRLNIRYRKKDGKLDFPHIINGTAFAIGRIIIAILENYQQQDGSIKIPAVLEKYLSFKEIKR